MKSTVIHCLKGGLELDQAAVKMTLIGVVFIVWIHYTSLLCFVFFIVCYWPLQCPCDKIWMYLAILVKIKQHGLFIWKKEKLNCFTFTAWLQSWSLRENLGHNSTQNQCLIKLQIWYMKHAVWSLDIKRQYVWLFMIKGHLFSTLYQNLSIWHWILVWFIFLFFFFIIGFC